MKNRKQETADTSDLLAVQSLSKAFGGLQALYDVSFTVERGTIYGLIGPNGAGKTTLFNLITGVFSPDEGRILFENKEIQGIPIYDVVKTGIARTFQNVELFGGMTVLENVMVGCHVRSRSGFLGAVSRLPRVMKEERRIKQKSLELLDFVGLMPYSDQKSTDIPLGRQRMLEIARALAAVPDLLLLDEPAAGLNAVETRSLGELIAKIKEKGITMILVEHDMSLTMKVSDMVVVLDQGQKIAEGVPKDIQSDETVMAAYLGKSG